MRQVGVVDCLAGARCCVGRAAIFALVCAACGWPSTKTLAAPPKVPGLPPQAFEYVKYAIQDLPEHFKNGEVAALDNTPADNLLSDAGATLGRVLFYDTRMSHDGSTSCASCHRQENGFSDPNRFSTGIGGQLTGRHSMALANGNYYVSGAAFWDERAGSLEEQALIPIESPAEMGSTLSEVVSKLSATAFYPPLFQAAFGSPEVTPERIGKAIAQFERAMVSYQAKYDTAFAPGSQEPDFAAVFTADELAGEALFHGAGRCGGCHTTHAQVGQQAANVGLDAVIVDEGAGQGRFKTPSLRNIAVRGHFMHDGRFSTIEEVVEFYNSQVEDTPNLDQSLRDPVQLGLTPQEVQQLVAFLGTLTDDEFLTSELFSDPFVTLAGDYNGNGVVDAADFEIWKSSFGATAGLAADGNGDLVVNAADYVIWRDNMGKTWQSLGGATSQGSSAMGVPEPGTMALAVAAVVGALSLRQRKRRI